MSTTETIRPTSRNWRLLISKLAGCSSGVLLISFVVSFSTRWDLLNFPTIIPLFLWLILGLFFSLLVRHSSGVRYSLISAWILSAFLLGDSPINLLRTLVPVSSRWEALRNEGRGIRVISINCQNLIGAIEELESLDPDIILIQESPPSKGLDEVIARSFPGWDFVWSPDAALMVRGKAIPHTIPNELKSQYVLASVELHSGVRLNVGSTRLVPVPLRFDIWNPKAWTSYTENRKRRRIQLEKIHHLVKTSIEQSVPSNIPLVFGGDFNAPAQDDVFRILKPTLRDAWDEAGRGWGKTIVNHFPIQRIDAVWISSHLHGVSVVSSRSKHSDHRMVISDLRID